jgi:hypothetical protein
MLPGKFKFSRLLADLSQLRIGIIGVGMRRQLPFTARLGY